MVTSAAKSSRRSAASCARRRAARARARGVVRSCGTGSDLHAVEIDLGLGVVLGSDPETRLGFGVVRRDAVGADVDADVDAEIRVDIASAAVGVKDAKDSPASEDIFFRVVLCRVERNVRR